MKFNDFIVSEEKVRLDPKCWTGKKIGNPKTKVKGGVRVNNCVPAESVEEAANPAQQAAIAIAKKKKAGVKEAFNPVSEGMPADNDMGATPSGAKMTLGQWKQMWMKKMPNADFAAMFRSPPNMQGSAIAYFDGWMNNPDARWDPQQGVAEAMRPIPVDDKGNRIPDRMSSNAPNRPFGQPGDAKSSSQGVVTYTPTGIVHRSNHGDVTPRPRAVPEGSQRVDSLVTDALKIMQGSEASDAVAALKTVLGDREYNSRRGFYNFYVRQLMDMSGQQGMAEDYNPEYDDEAGMVENNLETLDRAVEGLDDLINSGDNLPEWCQEKIAVAKSMLVAVWDYMYSEEASDEVDPEVDEMFEAMDQLAEEMARKKGVSVDLVWETFEAMDDNMLYETAAWRRKEGKSAKGGLNAKGVASYRRENPGSKLQTAVTTKPSKLKPGSKAAKRRKSFCARMGGVKGPMKKPNGKPTRKALALRKWNC